MASYWVCLHKSSTGKHTIREGVRHPKKHFPPNLVSGTALRSIYDVNLGPFMNNIVKPRLGIVPEDVRWQGRRPPLYLIHISVSVCHSVCLSRWLSIISAIFYLSVSVSVSVCHSVCLSRWLSIISAIFYLSVSVCVSVCHSVCLSLWLSIISAIFYLSVPVSLSVSLSPILRPTPIHLFR